MYLGIIKYNITHLLYLLNNNNNSFMHFLKLETHK